MILERGTQIAAVEIKSGLTVASDAFGPLNRWRKYAAERGSFSAVHPALVYGGDARFTRDGVDPLSFLQAMQQKHFLKMKNTSSG